MQIRLTESEIIDIVRQHLKAKNIDAPNLDVETQDNEMVIIADNVSIATPGGRAYTNPSRPLKDGRINANGVDGQRIFVNGVNDWNKQIQTSKVFTDDLAETLGQVFTSFNEVVDSMTKEKKDIDLQKIKDMFKPRDSK